MSSALDLKETDPPDSKRGWLTAREAKGRPARERKVGEIKTERKEVRKEQNSGPWWCSLQDPLGI